MFPVIGASHSWSHLILITSSRPHLSALCWDCSHTFSLPHKGDCVCFNGSSWMAPTTANSILRPVTLLVLQSLSAPNAFFLAEARADLFKLQMGSCHFFTLKSPPSKGPFLPQIQVAQHLEVVVSFPECHEVIDILNHTIWDKMIF